MSDRMRTLPFDKLIRWILQENENEKSIFGVPIQKYYKASGHNRLTLFERQLENPLGPAAGPHTQLAQNIIASYVAGSRFFELKTVQIIDGEELPVSKPCILANDEGYNVEWSTELTVPEALGEYIKAWFVLNILSRELSLGSGTGFDFNMSIGYDLEGIKSPKIDSFIEGLKDASQTAIWKECKDFLLHNLSLFHNITQEFVENISPFLCRSVTLSTLHGCPPAEIEKIAAYLLREKKLQTYVKCNPTLLGYQFVRKTLDQMGYDYLDFDEHHFNNDLHFEDAIPLITRLKALADSQGLIFGVKLTNTFPVKIVNQELSGEEMYLSGRPLYPLTINLAYRLAKEFDGDIRISYSGGADFFNIIRIYKTGIWPITLATTILKPGGYYRFRQMADLLEKESIGFEFTGIDVNKLQRLAEESVTDKKHLKDYRDIVNQKIRKKVPLTDCFLAPCKNECPIGQDIPEYLRLIGEERYLEALEVIVEKNPLPFITGTLCNHRCMTVCTRQNHDEPVSIREAKLLAARKAYEEFMSKQKPPEINSAYKVAVIGGGPAGLAGAYFLAKNGIDVTVFEKREEIGGVIQNLAPDFRISEEAIHHDMELIRKMGVKFRLGVAADFSVEALKEEGYQYIFIAIGAGKPGELKLEACDREILNVLEFLETYKKLSRQAASPKSEPLKLLNLGKSVAVIGAGNSAMDAARAAKRVTGVEKVSIIYRRTKKYMPADREELELAFNEGVEMKELLAPVSYLNGVLRCQKMSLGAPDASGRRSPVAVDGEFIELNVDCIIAAVGEQVETDLFLKNKIELDSKGRVKVNPDTNETSVENVFIGGDALRGPATIVEGIADGTKFARTVMEREKLHHKEPKKVVEFNAEKQMEQIKNKKGVLKNTCSPCEDSDRCLECNKVCNLCAEVCPNRANIAVTIASNSLNCINQIIHVDGMCNECGNCETFCPYQSAPYKDKFTLYWSMEDFEDSKNDGFLLLDRTSGLFRVRLENKLMDITIDQRESCCSSLPTEISDVIRTMYQNYSYVL
jgi:putative selenate reductase